MDAYNDPSTRSRSYSPPRNTYRRRIIRRGRPPPPEYDEYARDSRSPSPPSPRRPSRGGPGAGAFSSRGRPGSGNSANRPPSQGPPGGGKSSGGSAHNGANTSNGAPPPPGSTPGGRQRRSRIYPPNDYDGGDHNDDSPPRRGRKREITLLLCVYHSTSHKWLTAPVTFRPSRTTDRELWEDIANTFHSDLQKWWRRIFGFMRVKNIVPIAFTPNGVPIRTDPKDFPGSRQLVHAYHYPQEISDRTTHWVQYFVTFDAGDTRTNGLEFVEGLWAEKLGAVAIAASIAIIVVSIVWCLKGGQLQTVFTVMGFVLSFVAAEIGLAALYYQIISGQTPSN